MILATSLAIKLLKTGILNENQFVEVKFFIECTQKSHTRGLMPLEAFI